MNSENVLGYVFSAMAACVVGFFVVVVIAAFAVKPLDPAKPNQILCYNDIGSVAVRENGFNLNIAAHSANPIIKFNRVSDKKAMIVVGLDCVVQTY